MSEREQFEAAMREMTEREQFEAAMREQGWPSHALGLDASGPLPVPGVRVTLQEPRYLNDQVEFMWRGWRARAAAPVKRPTKGDPMLDAVLKTDNPEFHEWVESLPQQYWARYDLSACYIGWHYGREKLMQRAAVLAAIAERADAPANQAEPVAWIDGSGHPKHLSYRQGARERELYGPLQPLFRATKEGT